MDATSDRHAAALTLTAELKTKVIAQAKTKLNKESRRVHNLEAVLNTPVTCVTAMHSNCVQHMLRLGSKLHDDYTVQAKLPSTAVRCGTSDGHAKMSRYHNLIMHKVHVNLSETRCEHWQASIAINAGAQTCSVVACVSMQSGRHAVGHWEAWK